MACLDDADLAGLLEGALGPGELARVDAHVDVCATCRIVVADLIVAGSGDAGVTVRRALPPTPERAPEVGRRYVLIELIGQGGMGRVYRALDRLTGQTVALKRMLVGARAGGSTSSGGFAAPAQEFRALATLRHPNIVSVLDYGFDLERQPYFTMELLEGAQPVLACARALPRAARVGLLVQVLRALGYLHRRGILHRDLKPTNLLVVARAEGPALKVVDFGLSASLTEPRRERVAGTLPYMAPELLRGGAASEASDLYAVGVVACEVLCGHRPFRGGGTAAELIAEVLDREPDLAPLPPELGAVLRRALSKSPSGRQADAPALLRELSAAAGLAEERDPALSRDSYLVAARFTGRGEELGRLAGALDAARLGHGSAWLVGGESGVGKSRLLEELRSCALVEGVLTARGQGLANAGTAYHVWSGVLALLALHVQLSDLEASVLGAVLPNLGALLEREVSPPQELDVQATRSRLLRVLRDVVARSGDPVLVLLEDLQWADAESLALLAQVTLDLERAPLLVLGSYRDDEAPRLPAELPAMHALRLERFGRQGVAELCASMLGPAGRDERLVDLVARETEGNAYFIVEVLRALAEESGGLGIGGHGLPERVLAGGVEQVFDRRLARVPEGARSLLHLAAVAGRQLDLDVLSRSSPGIESLVLQCAEAGVLEVHEQRWRFGHDRLRERVIRGLDAGALAGLHARLAEDLEATYGESPAHAGQIAHGYREAGRPGPAARWYAIAGEAALARGAPGEAAAMLEEARALHLRLDVPVPAQVRVWRGLAQARYGLGQLTETDAALRRVCALSGAPLPSRGRGWWWAMGGQIAEQVSRRAGLARRLGLDPEGMDARALSEDLLLALWVQEVYVWLAEPEILILCSLWGLNLEEALGTRQRTNFLSALSFLLSYTPLHRLCRHTLARAEATSPPGTRAEVDFLRVQAIVALNRGRWAEAVASASRAVACARALQDDVSTMSSLLQLQFATAGLDDYRGVLAISNEIEILAARTENRRFTTIALLGQGLAWILLGDPAQAEAVIGRAQDDARHELGPLQEAIGAGFSALCALRQGRRGRADALAGEAMDAVERTRWPMLELRHALFCVLEVHLDDGRRDRSEAEIRRALAALRRLERRFPLAEPSARLFRGRHAWLSGRPGHAALSLRRGLSAAERMGSRYELALSHYWMGRLAASAEGRWHVPEGAAHHLRAALALFEQLSVPWEAARARAALESAP